jgi:hypothetical protein
MMRSIPNNPPPSVNLKFKDLVPGDEFAFYHTELRQFIPCRKVPQVGNVNVRYLNRHDHPSKGAISDLNYMYDEMEIYRIKDIELRFTIIYEAKP